MKNYNYPDKNGQFGQYGGRVVPPALEEVLKEVEAAYLGLRDDPQFIEELNHLHQTYTGRPNQLYLADSLTKKAGGAKIYLKREDLNHTGAHKINNTLGQALVAKKLGKTKLIAETGAGQHGVAVATVAAKFGMECDIYMGQRDVTNQSMNVYRMKLLGANVISVTTGQKTLKDAIDVALGAFIAEPDTYYMLGSAVGPHPYPMMVRDFQSVIGKEAREQILKAEGKLPDYAVACVGGGSNALGLFTDFIPDEGVKLIAVEPAGKGANTNQHGLALGKGKPGVIHGFECLVLQDDQGEIVESYSAASGLDYPGVGPEFCLLKDLGRVEIVGVTDDEAVKAFQLLSKTEGTIPALESAHAIAYAVELASKLKKDQTIIVNLSGRGDKDVKNVYQNLIKKDQ
ncbi:MAG: tryptophan synthase subunit beta [Candidatus Pacebacteria bacterium]|jgi:tryptophan synthase beta chain|nr:tryptophan synthase subunit beta [Candidatus Paceibacterota bacterium]MBT3511461.1 tryptophan synthase subunit beta [Candidatus Paceibacterota bacterium]MBT4004685.1 tryptophan synthase subunit beta [Candidatus Paceibacterota bacterium]MBT4358396.1 tryptophan synthase subunit beta [Candidatus Paceibacterota bacterium]MBT4680831.1 tryptophan synthase subunit beta [Candidatus Paceibacterota bacterium]